MPSLRDGRTMLMDVPSVAELLVQPGKRRWIVSNDLLAPKLEAPCLALRPRDAAKALGVSERTLWDWTQRGDVPHVRRGKTILYPVDVLRRWLDEQAKATPAAAEGGAA